jgi:RND family efflux transporter MFP subunit
VAAVKSSLETCKSSDEVVMPMPGRHRVPRLLAVAVLCFVGCREQNQFVPPPPPQVTVAHPVEQPVADTIEFVGNTAATETVDLVARVEGHLERVLFEDGARVAKGDLLFVIDQALYQVALSAAQAELQKAQASLQLAESQLRRIAPLVRSGAVTQEEYDVQAAQVATSKAEVAAAQALIARAELDLGYTQINAPIAGTISERQVDVGNLIRAEQTRLATIQNIDPIYVYFNLSERDLLRFMEMLRAHEIPDPEKNPPVLHVGLANEEGYPHEGLLDYRQLGVDPATGTTMRRGVFPNPDRQLIPGMFVRIRATIGEPVPRLLVDERAIGSDQRGDYVLVVNDKNIVEYRPVRLGIDVKGLRVVESGIDAGDRVVINGLQRARPGAEVQPEMAPMAADQQPDAATSS